MLQLLRLDYLSHLNDDNFGSGLLLELFDGLSSLSDDESDLVSRDHHLEGGASGSGGSSTAGASAEGVPWGTVAFVADDPLNVGTGSPAKAKMSFNEF